jgi:hypothetical protein
VAEGAELVIACGGDGTVNEVLNGLVPGTATLGIFPGGTANIIGKELHLSHNPARAARALPKWTPRRIALGRATWNDAETGEPRSRVFISVAGVGFDAYIVHSLSWSLKMGWGVIGYGLEAVRQALRYPFPPFRFEIDGNEVKRHSPSYIALALRRMAAARPCKSLQAGFHGVLFKPGSRCFVYALGISSSQCGFDVELVDGFRSPAMMDRCSRFISAGWHSWALPATFEILPDALTVLVARGQSPRSQPLPQSRGLNRKTRFAAALIARTSLLTSM